ncbi:MAG: DUF3047 domain-containing protein [Methylocystaceae bacterium]|nr:DUF3047 domain-containing protein [Methylocystaceae bacterium]
MMRTGLFLGLLLLVSLTALAQEKPQDYLLEKDGWRILKFDDKNANRFAAQSDGTIFVSSDDSVSVLYKDVQVDLAQTPILSWSWKVDKSVPPTDLSTKGKDDRSLALYVSFPFDYERAGFWERFIRDIIVAFKGKDTPGRVISYVWGGNAEKGNILESPYLKSAGALIVLQKAQKGDWVRESVNVAKDYERIFGQPANQPYQIAISADSDDTKVSSIGWVKDIKFGSGP